MTLLAGERSDAEPDIGPAVLEEPVARRKVRQSFRRVMYDTRLDRFLVQEKIGLDDLAALAGMTRTSLARLREGKHEPRQGTIVQMVLALRKMTGERIYASDLFYLGEAEDDDTPEAKAFLARGHART